jgi:RNA polymerase sigma-70 factor (ECF subfamily)
MINIDESNDFLLIDETLQGRVRSFGAIVIKYQDRIYSLVVKSIRSQEDAKDIVQNVFTNAFTNLKKFRKECSFRTWLYRIAINQIKNYWRSNKNKFVIAESELKPLPEKNGNWFKEISDEKKEVDSEESKQLANDLISFLPLEQKQIFIFHYVAGYSCQEIAEIFKTSPSNVKIQLYRGREYLYKKFKNIFN